MPVPFDVNDAFGLDLEDEFEVIRRPVSIDSNGRGTVSPHSLGLQYGVVVPPSATSLDRLSDYGVISKAIQVITPFRLYFLTEGYQPDYIIYQGDQFIVASLSDYSQFGRGFVSATCILTQASTHEPR